MSEKTIYDVDRAKFEGFGTYKLPIEERVNEIMEVTKKEYRFNILMLIIIYYGCVL